MKPAITLALAAVCGLGGLWVLHGLMTANSASQAADNLTGGWFPPFDGGAGSALAGGSSDVSGLDASQLVAAAQASTAAGQTTGKTINTGTGSASVSGYKSAAGTDLAIAPGGIIPQGWYVSQAGLADVAGGLWPASDPLIFNARQNFGGGL